MAFVQRSSARDTVPARCPHGARTVPVRCPLGKTKVPVVLDLKKRRPPPKLFFQDQEPRAPWFFLTGTVRAPYGHRAGTVRAPHGVSAAMPMSVLMKGWSSGRAATKCKRIVPGKRLFPPLLLPSSSLMWWREGPRQDLMVGTCVEETRAAMVP